MLIFVIGEAQKPTNFPLPEPEPESESESEKFTITQLFASLVIIGDVYLVNKKNKAL